MKEPRSSSDVTDRNEAVGRLSAVRLVTIYATGAFGLSINAMVMFLVPLRADELGAPLPVIGVIVGAKAFVEALLSVPLGTVIDRVGPRRAFMLGTGLSMLISIGFAASPSYWGLLIAQVFLGMARPLGWVGSQSYVAGLGADSVRARHTGRFSFASTVGQIAAPLLVGGVAQVVGYRVAFLVLAAYAAAFVLLGLSLPDLARVVRPQGTRTGTGLRAATQLLRLNRIQVAMLLTFVRLWIPAVWTAFFPLFLVRRGVEPAVAATVVAGMAVVATLTTLSAGALARRTTPEIVTAAALGLASLGLAISPLLASVPLVYLPAGLVGIGQGLSLPLLITIVSGAVPSHQRGLALGLRSSVNQASAAAAPMLMGPLSAAVGVVLGFPVSATAALALLGAAVFLHWRTYRAQDNNSGEVARN